MKKNLIPFLFFTAFLSCIGLHAPAQEIIIVEAGTTLLDYFTVEERYLYPEFTIGRILFVQGTYTERNINYNYLNGEIEYLQKSDTLSIVNKEDIKFITVANDTFYYHKGYIRQIKDDYPKVGLKHFLEFKEIRKKDSYGTASSGGSTISYNAMPSDGNFYKLRANNDMVFGKTRQYFISTKENGFVFFNRKNVLRLFPQSKSKIKSYLKSNSIKFDSEEDLLRFADYLGTL
jgi:hypothetical protein